MRGEEEEGQSIWRGRNGVMEEVILLEEWNRIGGRVRMKLDILAGSL